MSLKFNLPGHLFRDPITAAAVATICLITRRHYVNVHLQRFSPTQFEGLRTGDATSAQTR